MRDGLKLRERIQLSLDDRQVAALAVGALLLLAGMFALGLLVGMQVARRSPQPPPMGDLAALDAQRAQPQRAAPSAAEPKPQVPSVQPQAPRPGIAAPAADRPAQDARVVASSPVRIDPPPKKEVPPPATTVSITPPRPVAVAPAETDAPLPPPPSRLGAYTVQLGASQHRTEALQLASRAAAAGLRPYVVEARLPAKDGLWYRVRVGAFSDKKSAERYRRDVDRELRTSAVVMPTR
jgi:cell division septation protein DedD